MELSASEVWLQILDEARAALPDQAYRTWLASTKAVSVSGDTLFVSTPNAFAVEWVEEKYADLLATIAERLFGKRYRLTVQHTPEGRMVERPPTVDVPLPIPVAARPGKTANGSEAPSSGSASHVHF